jgi:tetratricopeptide (TPR) repeat protein
VTQVPTAVTASAVEAQISDLFAVADVLRREGRSALALPILQMLSRLHPGRDAIRLAHVRTLSELGRTLEAIAELNALKQRSASTGVLAAIQGEARVAIEKFNACLARNEPVEAERYAAALAELLPQHSPSLQAAMTCNVALGRTAEAVRYGRTILMLEPENVEVQRLLTTLLNPPAVQAEQPAAETKPAPRKARRAAKG